MDSQSASFHAGETKAQAQEKSSGLVQRAQDAAHSAAQSVQNAAHHASESVHEAGQQMQLRAEETTDSAKDSTTHH